MARCSLTGKSSLKANSVSKSNIRTRKWQKANVHKKRVFDEELGRFVRLKISSNALRCINKMGLSAYLRKKNILLKEVEIK